MSASSITIRNRETLFNKLENDLIEQGNKYILSRDFRLGEGVNLNKVSFLMQYTDLLCNYNCDINNIIEERIKGLHKIKCNVKLVCDIDIAYNKSCEDKKCIAETCINNLKEIKW